MPLFALLLSAVACLAQTEPGEELALRSDPGWQQLVVVLNNGRRVTYQRSEVKSVLYVNADFSSSFLGGATLSGEARDGARVWPFKIHIANHNTSSGEITGEITWSTLSSAHRIRGNWKGKSFTFTETEAIRAGSAHLRCTYSLTVSATGAQGSYVDPTDNGRGTVVIHNK